MNRSEIWLINLDPAIGAEIKKSRPVVIVSSNAAGVLPLRVIVPITDWKDRYQNAEWMVKITPNKQNGLIKDSAADSFQVRSVSVSRFIKKIGVVSQSEIDDIAEAIALVVEYPSIIR